MTHIELRDLLEKRIGWKQPIDAVITVNADNVTSESGRYFQDEYPSVTIANIIDTIPLDTVPTELQVNTFLSDLRKATISLVVADVYRTIAIDEELVSNCVTLFDNAISKRMAISVGELIWNTTNSTRKNRINKEIQQKVFFELNGNADSSSSRANQDFPTYVGLKSRYGAEIKELRDILQQEYKLDTFTYRVPDYYNDDDYISFNLSGRLLNINSIGGFLRID